MDNIAWGFFYLFSEINMAAWGSSNSNIQLKKSTHSKFKSNKLLIQNDKNIQNQLENCEINTNQNGNYQKNYLWDYVIQ